MRVGERRGLDEELLAICRRFGKILHEDREMGTIAATLHSPGRWSQLKVPLPASPMCL